MPETMSIENNKERGLLLYMRKRTYVKGHIDSDPASNTSLPYFPEFDNEQNEETVRRLNRIYWPRPELTVPADRMQSNLTIHYERGGY